MHFLESGLTHRRNPPFVVEHYAKFLAGKVDELKALYVKDVRKKAVLHEHGGLELSRDVKAVLVSIPGLELVEIPQMTELAYNCGIGSLGMAAQAQEAVHRRLLREASAAGVDLLLTPSHACQMGLAERRHVMPCR